MSMPNNKTDVRQNRVQTIVDRERQDKTKAKTMQTKQNQTEENKQTRDLREKKCNKAINIP